MSVKPGLFLEWNEQAADDPGRRYVLLIEELTRANVSAVLGELMTYIEHRDRPFQAVYSRRPVRVAQNITIIATYNPTDRSAIEIDSALLRRLRIIDFPPSPEQLTEMLSTTDIKAGVIAKLQDIFNTCKTKHPKDYESLMPFGHGIFADITSESPDLHRLWKERIRHILRRPLMDPHPFTDTIEKAYPWRDERSRNIGYGIPHLAHSGRRAKS